MSPAGDAASTVTVRLHTTHEAEGIEDGIDQTLANISGLAGSTAASTPARARADLSLSATIMQSAGS